jgi:hypothetical protein
MNIHRFIAYTFSGLTCIFSLLVYGKYIYLLGFPDGFISELAQAQQKTAYLFIGISLALGVWFGYLGNAAKKTNIQPKLFISIFIYLVAITGISALNYYYQLHLSNGSGG